MIYLDLEWVLVDREYLETEDGRLSAFQTSELNNKNINILHRELVIFCLQGIRMLRSTREEQITSNQLFRKENSPLYFQILLKFKLKKRFFNFTKCGWITPCLCLLPMAEEGKKSTLHFSFRPNGFFGLTNFNPK